MGAVDHQHRDLHPRGAEAIVQDTMIFAFGLFVFTILAIGLIATLLQFRKMGNRDQVDSYPRSRSKSS